jgi:hypothetical protein
MPTWIGRWTCVNARNRGLLLVFPLDVEQMERKFSAGGMVC